MLVTSGMCPSITRSGWTNLAKHHSINCSYRRGLERLPCVCCLHPPKLTRSRRPVACRLQPTAPVTELLGGDPCLILARLAQHIAAPPERLCSVCPLQRQRAFNTAELKVRSGSSGRSSRCGCR